MSPSFPTSPSVSSPRSPSALRKMVAMAAMANEQSLSSCCCWLQPAKARAGRDHGWPRPGRRLAPRCHRRSPAESRSRPCRCVVPLFCKGEERDLGLEYETTQGSRCEAKTHMNSAYGLQLIRGKLRVPDASCVFLYFCFCRFLGEHWKCIVIHSVVVK